MLGRLSYVVAHDPAPQVPEVREAIRKGMPLIATFEDAQVTTPVGGVGQSPAVTVASTVSAAT